MSLNFTALGFDQDLFTDANTAIHLILFLTFTLPTIILNLLCIVAAPCAKKINWQMVVMIINLLPAETVRQFGTSVDYIGYPLRSASKNSKANNIACNINTAFESISFLVNNFAIVLYAIVVYIYIKYGIKKAKWRFILSYIVISWTLSIFVGILIATRVVDTGAESVDGFCIINVTTSRPSSLIMPVVILLTLIITLCIVLVLSILTYCYHEEEHSRR